MATILIVDDEKNIRDGLCKSLEYDGYAVHTAENGKEGIARVYKGGIDLVIADLKMPEMSGEEMLAEMLEFDRYIPVIIITGHGDVGKAVEMMRLGAYDFLTKPLNIDKLSLIVARALETKRIKREKDVLESRVVYDESFQGMIGKSRSMQKIYDQIKSVAPTKATVLIEGESGTGKELVANAIHALSDRVKAPLIKVNCAALSEGVLESELFGHEKGSFTGAMARKIGRFEAANTGTIFIDEIGELTPALQVKLLRVLEQHVIERVGSNEPIPVDIRIITATNKHLLDEVREKRFREDLFYRLNVVKIELPPLRERREDIPLLINNFIKEFSREHRKEIQEIAPKVYKTLSSMRWDGNIRQLRNTIENMVVMSSGSALTENNIPGELSSEPAAGGFTVEGMPLLEEVEKQYISHVLAAHKFNKVKAAKVLGIERATLYRKMGEMVSDEAEG
ncbi:MAG: sigma-54-dependent Fis family transcriptional regulator [Spirochaetes bacterium]|nr:sigma-54-dependent Fis family transcriptional regulator [Spirochaetota bacterium]